MKILRSMFESYFAWRVALITILCVLVFAQVTIGVSNMLSPSIFTKAQQKELIPRAHYVAEQVAETYAEGGWEAVKTSDLLSADTRQWGASILLYDTERTLLHTTRESFASAYYENADPFGFKPLAQNVLAGETVSALHKVTQPYAQGQNGEVLGIVLTGAPVVVGGEIIGAVILVSETAQILSSVETLTRTLTYIGIAVLALLVPFASWSSHLILRPIAHIRDTAVKMAAGDYNAVADLHAEGEVGELSSALNQLSGELQKTLSALTVERNRALCIINALDEGIFLLDPSLNVIRSNPAMTALVGGNSLDALPDFVRETVSEAVSLRRSAEVSFTANDLQLRLTLIPLSGEKTGYDGALAVCRDETQAFRLEQTRRDYVANVTHELRTPLTAVRALIEPLCDGMVRDEGKRQELYEIILCETKRLSRLVDEMLALSRLQSSAATPQKHSFSPEALLQHAADVCLVKVFKSGRSLRLVLPKPPLPPVYSSMDHAHQVLSTLLDNAINHTPAGTEITLSAAADAQCVRIFVEDNGPGIAEADLPHVFERFYKADKSPHGCGSGLGLAIAKETLASIGETIGAENRAEGGARFWFTLSLDTAQEAKKA